MRNLSKSGVANLYLILAILLGGWVRFYGPGVAGFPVNDGGMFYVMIRDLQSNGYLLPGTTTYNLSEIPYAYPPLGFYLGALLSAILKIDPVDVLRWLPALLSTLSIFMLYRFAVRLLGSTFQASLAALFFALMPRAVATFVSGGGLTRSLGQFFMLLTLASVLDLYKGTRKRDIFLVVLFGSLTVISHPEAAIYTITFSILIWIFTSGTRAGFLKSILAASGILLFTSPWWVVVLGNAGVQSIVSALHTGGNSYAIFNLFFFTFLQEPYVTVLTVLGLLGLAAQLVRRRFLLIALLILPFLVEGRSATTVAIIPFALLVALGLTDVLFPGLRSVGNTLAREDGLTSSEIIFIGVLVFYSLTASHQASSQIGLNALSAGNREAMVWVRRNTRPESGFLVLTGARSAVCDPVSEWFPAFAERKSLVTVQGTEWRLGEDFGAFLRHAREVQECLYGSIGCLEAAALKYDLDPDYLYISKRLVADDCKPLVPPPDFNYFLDSLRADPHYRSVYDTDSVVIYQLQ